MKNIINTIFLLGLLSFLTACGGGGGGTSAITYDGTTTKASITDTNAQSLSVSSAEAAKQANSANNFSTFKTNASSFDIDSFVKKTADAAINNYAYDISTGLCTSGSASIDGIDQNTDINSNLNLTINYNNCTIADMLIQ